MVDRMLVRFGVVLDESILGLLSGRSRRLSSIGGSCYHLVPIGSIGVLSIPKTPRLHPSHQEECSSQCRKDSRTHAP